MFFDEEKQLDPNKLRYVIYKRKSSEENDRQVLSLRSQDDVLKKLCKRHNLNIIADFEESASAYSPGRPEFKRMLQILEEGKADAILCCHLSRLSRNALDTGVLLHKLHTGEIHVVRTPEKIYDKNSDDGFIMALQLAMSKKSSDDTSNFVQRDIKAKLRKGEYPSNAPLGYLNIDKDGKISGKRFTIEKQSVLEESRHRLKRVEQDPIIAPLVKKLFILSATGKYTLAHLRRESESWGLIATRSKKMLSKQTIHRILTNPFYYGAIPWKESIIEPDELPEETRHEALITKELFHRTQEALGLRSKPHSAKNYYRYTNSMACGECGKNISALTAKGHVYYRCMKCKGIAYTPETEIDKQLEALLEDIQIDEEFYELAIEEINKTNAGEVEMYNAKRKKQTAELKNIETKFQNLVSLKISPENKEGDLLSIEDFKYQKEMLTKQRQLIQDEMGVTEKNEEVWYEACVSYLDFVKNIKDRFYGTTPEEKRDMFQFFYYNPVLKDQTVLYTAKSPHLYLIEYNRKKKVTITKEIGLMKTKTRVVTPVLDDWRTGRGSNPQLPP